MSMRVAIVGSENSLKMPAVHGVSKILGIQPDIPDMGGAMKKHGIKGAEDFKEPALVYKLLDTLDDDHKRKVVAAQNIISGFTTIEMLAYYLYWCVKDFDTEHTRTVFKNCIDFARRHYDGVFLVIVDKDTHDNEAKPIFGGDLFFEYMMEYIMRGILERFGINHHIIHGKNVETVISDITERM